MGHLTKCGNPGCEEELSEAKQRRHAKYCSGRCASQHYNRRAGIVKPGVHSLASGTRGAISELIVVCDLLGRGFHVFRSVSPACPCDLVAYVSEGNPLRIEVTTGTRNHITGAVAFPKDVKSDKFDHVAVVTDGEIEYHPQLA